MNMSQELKMEWLPKLRVRYQKHHREGKSRMLDELCADYDYERNYAIKLLRGKSTPHALLSMEQARRHSATFSRKLRLPRAHGLTKKTQDSHRDLLTVEGRKLITLLMAARKAAIEQLTAFAA
jgi:hypothetical protein